MAPHWGAADLLAARRASVSDARLALLLAALPEILSCPDLAEYVVRTRSRLDAAIGGVVADWLASERSAATLASEIAAHVRAERQRAAAAAAAAAAQSRPELPARSVDRAGALRRGQYRGVPRAPHGTPGLHSRLARPDDPIAWQAIREQARDAIRAALAAAARERSPTIVVRRAGATVSAGPRSRRRGRKRR